MRALPAFLIAPLLVAAAAPARAQALGPWTEDEPPGAILRPRKAPPATPPSEGPCAVELSLDVVRRGKDLEVTARARNRTARPITIATAHRCGDPALFDGLPAGYDYHGTCRREFCPQLDPAWRLTLPAGQTQTLARVTIRPDGDACNEPLPPGKWALTLVAPTAEGDARVCGPRRPYVIERRAVVTPPPDPSTRREPTPSKEPHRCPPPVPCGIHCSYGYARDENGCALCSCITNPFEVARPR
jgi:hypothetical protein